MPDSTVHLRLAESGRQAALRGDHPAALAQYREAMRIAVADGAPEVFFRYYLEATLESLELMGSFDSVLDYCDRAVDHYGEHPPQHDLARLDLATIHQRRGAVLLKSGRAQEAGAAFEVAASQAAAIGARLDLARLVLDWQRRGLTVSADRLLAEQRRLGYFAIRRLPDEPGSGRQDSANRIDSAGSPQ